MNVRLANQDIHGGQSINLGLAAEDLSIKNQLSSKMSSLVEARWADPVHEVLDLFLQPPQATSSQLWGREYQNS